MMAKITKRVGFSAITNYVFNPEKKAELLDSQGVLVTDCNSMAMSFKMQSEMNPRISKPVGHISLNFSAQDTNQINNRLMVDVAREYMERMGIKNTQYVIGRHHDKDHPHIHIVFNRVDNDGRTISDKNDRYRSEKICKELTRKHGLYFSSGKENVKVHRLREPDKTKYEIYNAVKKELEGASNWKDLIKGLKKQAIETEFKYKGHSNVVQGIMFSKNGYQFSGSKVDMNFSYSKINSFLNNKNIEQRKTNTQDQEFQRFNTSGNSTIGSLLTSLSGLFEMNPHGNDLEEE